MIRAPQDHHQFVRPPHHAQPVQHAIQPQVHAVGILARLGMQRHALRQIEQEPLTTGMGAEAQRLLVMLQDQIIVTVAIQPPRIGRRPG